MYTTVAVSMVAHLRSTISWTYVNDETFFTTIVRNGVVATMPVPSPGKMLTRSAAPSLDCHNGIGEIERKPLCCVL